MLFSQHVVVSIKFWQFTPLILCFPKLVFIHLYSKYPHPEEQWSSETITASCLYCLPLCTLPEFRFYYPSSPGSGLPACSQNNEPFFTRLPKVIIINDVVQDSA